MTKRSTPVLPVIVPLSEDPTQSQFMRDLLQAGRDASVSDYNFEHGLSKHLSLIDTAAPTPHWAEALRQGAGAAPTAAGSSLLPWLAVPIVAAVVVTAAVFVSRQTAPQVMPAPQSAVPAAAAPANTVAPSAAAPTNAPSAQTRAVPAVAASSVSREASSARPGAARAARNERRATPIGSGAVKPASGTAPALRGGASSGTAPALRGGASSGTAPALRGGAPKVVGAPASAEPFAQAQPAVASHAATGQAHANEARTDAPAEEPAAPAEKPQAQVARNVPVQPVLQDDSKLEREMAMLAMAQRVLLTDPARSLGLARQGEAEFAGSMFTQERQQLLLLSLVRLGRLDEAKRLAKPYLTRYPAGPFSDRVRHALATGKVER